MQALLIAQDDSESAERGAARMRELCLAAGASMAEVSASRPSRAAARARRLPSRDRAAGRRLVEDVCVPRTRLPEMFAADRAGRPRHDVYIATVAHAGDGNLHPVFVFDRGLPEVRRAVWAAADEVFRAALDLGGTLTGEHGVGIIKRRWLGDELSGGVDGRPSRDQERARPGRDHEPGKGPVI